MILKTQGEQKANTQRPPINSNPNAAVKACRPGPFSFSSSNHNSQQKMSRRSSKPIIEWFQRKLAGRTVSSPAPAGKAHHTRKCNRTEPASTARLKAVSLNEDDDVQSYSEDDSLDGQSLTRDSSSSSTSMLEADDDASVRPLPPSAAPSPAPSRSSSPYPSDPRTFMSIAASSTKPTTVLSIDLPGNNMAHIAQVPITPSTSTKHHMGQSSSNNPHGPGNTSVGPSAFPSRSSRLLSSNNTQTHEFGPVLPFQVPLHTTHHPRNNPQPFSPPLDNASLLTLASSAYAIPTRLWPRGYSSGSAPPSVFSGGDSMSYLGGSMFLDENTSLFVPGDDRLYERDADASIRALRPRSSRRGSWGSEVSNWSAQTPQGPGTPPMSKEEGLWTSHSVGSGEAVAENGRNPGDSLDTENRNRADGGVQADIVSQIPPSRNHTSQHEVSIETPRGSTEAGEAISSQDVSTRVCYRSTSTDRVVGHKANDKEDISSAMLNVSIDDSEKSNSS